MLNIKVKVPSLFERLLSFLPNVISRSRVLQEVPWMDANMTTHLSVRLCWHDSGWNGNVCKVPEKNTFCVCVDIVRKKRDKAFAKTEKG